MASYYELAHMACDIYDLDVKYQKKNIPNWIPLLQTLIGGKRKSGLAACIYQNFFTKECVFAVKGTSDWPDFVSDFDFFMDSYMKYTFIPELSELMKHMFILKVHFPEYQYATITGHSLGGILAKMAAAITGDAEKVLAFNSPGVKAVLRYVPNSIIHHPRKVETIVTYGDHIGNYKREHDIGRYIEISNIASSSATRVASTSAIATGGAISGAGVGALIGSVVPGLGTALGAIGGAAAGAVGGAGWLELQEHKMLGVIKSMHEGKHHNFNMSF